MDKIPQKPSVGGVLSPRPASQEAQPHEKIYQVFFPKELGKQLSEEAKKRYLTFPAYTRMLVAKALEQQKMTGQKKTPKAPGV